MRVLVTGAGGQLGRELARTVPEGTEARCLSSRDLDLTDEDAVLRMVREIRPAAIVNAAAYTAVDRAESEPEAAFAVNARGTAHLAAAAAACGARLIHVSTDFVFDGRKSSPYLPTDPTGPLSVYGRSKLEGEQTLAGLVAERRCAVIRTAWVYSRWGKNFVKTMLHLMTTRESLRVVADQVGSPTWAHDLALGCWMALDSGAAGMFHLTAAGVASWYDFAVAIQEEALALGILRKEISIHPIRTEEYPTPAARPAYSVLDTRSFGEATGWRPRHWRASLRDMLKDVRALGWAEENP